jgi:CRP-like cAMP-binding protein
VVDIAELLGRAELFDTCSPEELGALVSGARTVELQRNDLVFAEDDEAAHLYIVGSGRVAISRASPDGRESLLALMEPDDLFGEMPLFDHGTRSAQARALEQSVIVEVPYRLISELYDRHPTLLHRVVGLLAQRLRTVDEALTDAMFLDVPGRTAKRLLELSGGQDSFELPITQEELAGMVGASRERVNKALSSFSRLGWVRVEQGTYTILRREALTLRSR